MKLRRDVFQAISDPTRRLILTLLSSQALSHGAIANHFDSTHQAISRHLKVLAECGLLAQEHSGRETFYRINGAAIKDVAEFIDQFRNLWAAKPVKNKPARL